MLYTLAVIWIYRDLWHQKGFATGLGWDAIDTHGPDLDFFSREIRENRFSLWNPYDKGGFPAYADAPFDRYYPFNWPFAGFGAVFGTGWWLVQIKVLAHHVAGASMMHLFLRSRGVSRGGAMIGGLGLIASTPLLIHKASDILWPMVWVPLVWLALDALFAKPSWRRGAALGGALLLCETAGSPPGLFYTLMLVAPYGLWRLATAKWSWQTLVALGVALVVALAPLLLVVLPQRQLVALGSRERWASGDDFALALSQPWRDVLRGVVARGAGLLEMYMGSVVLILALCALVCRPRWDKGIAWVWFVVAAFGVALACGDSGEVLPWIIHHVPGFKLLRVPGRYKLVAIWALAAMAGVGADGLDKRWRAIACAAAVFALVWYLIHEDAVVEASFARPDWWSVAATGAAAFVVCATALTSARWRGVGLATLAIGALFDAPTFLHTPDAPPVADRRREHELDDTILPTLDGVRDRFRLYDEFVLGERVGARNRVRDFRGYPAVDPLSQTRYVDVLEKAKVDPRILAEFNVRYVLSAPHFRFQSQSSYVRLPHPGFHRVRGDVWEADAPAPLVMWYGNAVLEREPGRVLDDVRGAHHRWAVLELGDAKQLPYELPFAEQGAIAGTLVSYDADEIRATVDAPRAGLVVLNELFYPGWQIEVDGAPAPMLRANYVMRGVWVGAGKHAITWRFAPRDFRPLFAAYAFAWLILLSAGVSAWRRR